MALDSYVTLGRSGLRVSPFTLGTMTFGEDLGWGASPEESANVLAAYLDHGGNSIDTANLYTNGHAEKILGDFFAAHPERRDRVVLGTKFFANLHAGDPNGGGVGRKGILHQLEDSLRRLRTDYVDIYWVHNYDPVTPLEETLRTLDDLVRAGKVRYIGLSDLPAYRIATGGDDHPVHLVDADHRAATGVLVAGADVRGRTDPGGAGVRHRGAAVESAEERVSVRALRQ